MISSSQRQPSSSITPAIAHASIAKGSDAVPAHRSAVGSDGNIAENRRYEDENIPSRNKASGYSNRDLEIEAENEDEAREKADDEVHYIEWDDGIDADLEIGEVTELTGVMDEEETAQG